MASLHEQADSLLLRVAGAHELPLVIHLTFLALLFTLLFGLFIGSWYKTALRRQRKAIAAKANKDAAGSLFKLPAHRRRNHFTSYGTSNLYKGLEISPTTWYGSPTPKRLVNSISLKSTIKRGVRHLEGWLLYQPAPLPLIQIELPCNGTTVSILTMYATVLLFLLSGIPFAPTIDYPLMLADRAGPSMATLLPCLYLFAAKNQPLQYFTGYSYEDLNVFHRRLGEIVMGLGTLHSTGKAALWYMHISAEQFIELKVGVKVLLFSGALHLLLHEVLFVTSNKSFRRRFHALFVRIHSYGQFPALVTLAVHSPMSRPYVIVSFLIFFIDRIVYRTLMRTRNVIARAKVFADGQTVNLKIDKESNGFQTCKALKKLGLKQSFQGDWLPTQHVFVRIPALTGHSSEMHPYFVACAAPCEQPWSSVIDLNLIIPARDAWSKSLLQIARRPFLYVDIDGPYGSNYASNMLQDCDTCVLVAGGDGIAGAWPLAWSLVDDDPQTDLESGRYGFVTRQNVLLIWSYRSVHEIEWIGGKEEIALLEKQGIKVVLVGPERGSLTTNFETDIDWWMYQNDPQDRLRTGIVCCGPPKLRRAVRNKASENVRSGRNVVYCDVSFDL